MTPDRSAKAQTFHELHLRPGIFLMPNAWNAGSARMLAAAGFPVIGTTSAGIAYSLGVPDDAGRVSRAQGHGTRPADIVLDTSVQLGKIRNMVSRNITKRSPTDALLRHFAAAPGHGPAA
ncbi:MAG: isocitrate lyase/phosphoenolpyruvate mutase family protein [Kiloniellaceae bacterium]